MNPYYLSTEALSYGFGNGYSSGSGTSSPAQGASGGGGGINPAAVGSGSGASPAEQAAAVPSAPATTATGPSGNGDEAGGNGNGNGAAAPLAGPLVTPHQDLNDFLESFWTRQMDGVEGETPDFKTYNLPLARIKKVMKSDEEVKMISAEAPIMFSKACEIFISELTCRAWLVAEGHKRRTLQKSDVASAIAFSDVFDFLIDIVPRDDGTEASASAPPAAASAANSVPDVGADAQHDATTADWSVAGAGGAADGSATAEERDSDALYSEYVQGEGEAFA